MLTIDPKFIELIHNTNMRVEEIRQFCRVQDEGQSLMRAAMSQLNLSAHAYHSILKLARTITDPGRRRSPAVI